MAQAPLIKPDGGDVDQQTAATCTKAATVQEPTCQQASIKAAVLFRPGSPICVGRCAGSPRPQSARRGAGKAAAAGDSMPYYRHACAACVAVCNQCSSD